MNNENWEIKIDGKRNIVFRLIFSLVFAGIFTALSLDQLLPAENKSKLLGLGFAVPAVAMLCCAVYIIMRAFCFKIFIGKAGFYCQTNPFDGKYYEYSTVGNANIRTQAGNNGSATRRYLIFKPNDENPKKILLDSVFEEDIDILIERINDK